MPLPSLPSSSSVAAAELSPTKRRPSSAVWALSSLDKERASERHFARGKILSGVFKGPEIRLLLLLIVTRQTRTRVCFMPCRDLPCVFPRLVLTCEYGLLHPTRSFSSLEIAWMRRADGARVCKGDAERKRGGRRGRCFCVNCLLPTSPLCRRTPLSPSSPFTVGFSGTKRGSARASACVYKVEEGGGRVCKKTKSSG